MFFLCFVYLNLFFVFRFLFELQMFICRIVRQVQVRFCVGLEEIDVEFVFELFSFLQGSREIIVILERKRKVLVEFQIKGFGDLEESQRFCGVYKYTRYRVFWRCCLVSLLIFVLLNNSKLVRLNNSRRCCFFCIQIVMLGIELENFDRYIVGINFYGFKNLFLIEGINKMLFA